MVVSPLSALMKDQVAAFSIYLCWAFVNDESASREQKRKIMQGECQLVLRHCLKLQNGVECFRLMCTGKILLDLLLTRLIVLKIGECKCIVHD